MDEEEDKGLPYERTPLEEIVAEFLALHGIQFEEQVSIDRYSIDFLVGNVDVEADGFNHSDPKRIRTDQRRDSQLRSLGYEVYRVHCKVGNIGHKRKRVGLDGQLEELLEFLEKTL